MVGRVQERLPHQECGSSRGLVVFEDGTGWCFACGTYVREPSSQIDSFPSKKGPTLAMTLDLTDITELPIRALPDRGISKETCEAYSVRVALSTTDGVTPTSHYYPVTHAGRVTGFKERIVSTKQFFTHGNCRDAELFGQSRIKSPQKTLYITEGECDALALYQCLRKHSSLPNWDPCVVSISTGSAGAAACIAHNFEWINQFGKVILVFDQDDPGQLAAEQVAKTLAGKSFIAKLDLKDPNEMLRAGKGEELYWAVLKHAKKYQPDGIVHGRDTWDRYRHSSSAVCYPYPESWSDLNGKTYGVREGSIVTVTSGTGAGKSTFVDELKYHYFNTTDFKIADISLEQDLGDTVGNLMALHMSKRIRLPDVKVTEDEETEAHTHLFQNSRWSFYDHFGGMDDDSLFSKIRYFAASGHKLIFLDHLSIVISEFADRGGERERIDAVMTKLARIAKEFGLIIFLVVHLRKVPGGKSFELGAIPTLDDLRGSGAIKQLSWDVLGLSRNQQHGDPICANTTLVSVLKCRFTGRTGASDFLYYSQDTGRMTKSDKPAGYDD